MVAISFSESRIPFVLSLDIGTSSTRAVLFDALGHTIEGFDARHDYEIITRTDGTAEADPDQLLEGLWRCIDQVLSRLGPKAVDIQAVSTCTIVSNILGINQDGKAVTPLITYADTRPAKEVNFLRRTLDEEYFHQKVGTLFHTSYWPSRFLWFYQQRPDIYLDVFRWITIGEYLILKLFGQSAVSYSVASWTGLLNRMTCDWDEELLSHLPISREKLSTLVDVDYYWSGLRHEFGQRWNWLKGARWYPAIGDGAGANLGSGCSVPNRVAVTMGTTTAVRVVLTDVPLVPRGLWCYRVDRRRNLLGGAMTEGGNIYSWLTRVLKVDESTLDQEVLQISPDQHGLTFLPLFSGERAPGWAADARGAITGLSLGTTPQELVRAGLEGVSYRVGLIFDLIKDSLPSQAQVIASGGALLHSKPLLHIMADVLNRQVITSPIPEASARGSALLALEKLGIFSDVSKAPVFTGEVYKPNFENHQKYLEAIKRQKDLYRKIILS